MPPPPQVIASYSICSALPKVDLSKIGSTLFKDATTGTSFEVEVISNTEDLLAMYVTRRVTTLQSISADCGWYIQVCQGV